MGTAALRAAITGLLGFAAAEEMLLTVAGTDAEEEAGARGAHGAHGARGVPGPDRWAAVPLLAHITEFKSQQSERIRAVVAGRTPPSFGDIDHTSASVYASYASLPADRVIADSRRAVTELVDGVRALADSDLLDPSRHPWLRGRTLWLQIIVRGFWHPAGHIADYYISHGRADRAVALQAHALATARYLDAPDMAAGMASYSLACAQCAAGLSASAAQTLAAAIALNPDVRANAERDPDLAALRDSGQLARILAAG